MTCIPNTKNLRYLNQRFKRQYKIFELYKYAEKCREERNKALFEKAETNKHDESESSAAEKNDEVDNLFKSLLNQMDNMIAEKELEENENW